MVAAQLRLRPQVRTRNSIHCAGQGEYVCDRTVDDSGSDGLSDVILCAGCDHLIDRQGASLAKSAFLIQVGEPNM